MARYFFDIDDGAEHRDKAGREIENIQALRGEALKSLRDFTKDTGDSYAIVLTVRNRYGANILTLRAICQFDDPASREGQIASY